MNAAEAYYIAMKNAPDAITREAEIRSQISTAAKLGFQEITVYYTTEMLLESLENAATKLRNDGYEISFSKQENRLYVLVSWAKAKEQARELQLGDIVNKHLITSHDETNQ